MSLVTRSLYHRDMNDKIPDVLLVMPERNLVRMAVEIHDAEPEHNPDEWDQVVESSLHLPTGHLEVWPWRYSKSIGFTVEPGWYRVRSFRTESGREGNDYWLLVLWPAPPAEVRVIKQTPKVPPPLIFEALLRRHWLS